MNITKEQVEALCDRLAEDIPSGELEGVAAMRDLAISALAARGGEPKKVYCVPYEGERASRDQLYTHHDEPVPMADNFVLYTHPKAEPGWQPIETAPKDGTNILLFNDKGNMATALWQGTGPMEGWWLRGGNKPDYFFNGHRSPTHWMPLPAAPQGDNNG